MRGKAGAKSEAKARHAGGSAPHQMSSPACRMLQDQILPKPGGDERFKSDQLVVIRNGKTIFDWNDGVVNKDAPRGMWSVSKTLTATLVATAVQDGKVKLDDPVVQYLPELLSARGADVKHLKKLKVRDLIEMTSGLKWTENNDAKAQDQSVLPFLYSDGYRNLVKYIGSKPFAHDPGEQWNYSSANAVLAMAVLRKAYGQEANDMPWNNLFRPLKMKSARFEKDRSGNYVGSAYIHLSARDLAKVGELYLNDGVVHGKRLLPEGWVKKITNTPVQKSIDNARAGGAFSQDGFFSKGSFWLNHAAPGIPRPYPHLPENMLIASGFGGQALIILPDQGLVIARTAHDHPTAKIQADVMISNAMKCFAPDAPGVPKGPPLPLKPEEQKDFNPLDFFEELKEFDYTLDRGMLPGMIAKEVCSCHFITGLAVDECFARSPIPPFAAKVLADITVDEQRKILNVTPRLSNRTTQARVNPRSSREGCGLSYGAAD